MNVSTICRVSILSVTVTLTSASAQRVLFVDADAPPGGDGLTWDTAFDDLQDALAGGDAADEVWVAAGVYVPGPAGETEATFALLDDLALYGGFAGTETQREQRDPLVNETVLSGDLGRDDVYGHPVWYIGWNINTDNCEHVVRAIGVGETAVLDGFTIMAGNALFGGGAGLRTENASPVIRNCRFWRNLGSFAAGGGALVIDGNPEFVDCVFHQNYVHLSRGGAVLLHGVSEVTIDGCAFTENISVGSATGGWTAGTGVAIESSLPTTIRRTTFADNEARNFWPANDDYGTYAGAIYHGSTAPLLVDRCRFYRNTSNNGGAIYSWGRLTVVNSVFVENVAPEYDTKPVGWGGGGGAISVRSAHPDDVMIVNSVFVDNDAEDTGGVLVLGSEPGVVANSIFWGNTDTLGSIGISQVDGADSSYSCIENMLVGEPGEDPPDPEDFPGCIDDDPAFVNAGAGDFRLSPGSPAIDAADNDAVPAWVELDLDDRARFVDDPDTPDTGNGVAPIVDMGAYEFGPVACAEDIDGSAEVDFDDLLRVLAAWGPCEGCPEDIDGDDNVGFSDLLLVLAAWGPCP